MLKKGDRVKVSDGGGYIFLDGKGRIFTVKKVHGSSSERMVDVINDRGEFLENFYIWRFDKIEIKKGTCDACNSNCKKDKICGLYLEE